jgi:GDP-L-fucose synthase
MKPEAKIYVAGHRGLVGSAIVRRLKRSGYHNLAVRTHDQLDLTDQSAVRTFFHREQPQYVFLAAAKVGGIMANSTYPAEFIFQNLQMQANIIDSAYRTRVDRLLFLGSSCIYPKFAEQPMRETALLSGPLEPTNRPYAVAKIAGIEMCRTYNLQYGTRYLAAMPTNLYGPGDNYDIETSHVIPALIRKIHQAKISGQPEVGLWGTGTPRREFLYSDDLADACVFLMSLPLDEFGSLVSNQKNAPLINIGTGQEQTISQLARIIADTLGFDGGLRFDPAKPDGTPRKLLDVSRLKALGWEPRTGLPEGLALAYEDFLKLAPCSRSMSISAAG